MAYFPNGASSDRFMEQYCLRCTNFKDIGDGRGPGCPIWDMHTVHNYDQHREPSLRRILDSFIPMKESGVYADRCVMFDPLDCEIEGQQHLDFTPEASK